MYGSNKFLFFKLFHLLKYLVICGHYLLKLEIYYHILNQYSSELLEIPWARTGCRYLSENSDNYLKNYHNYGKWIKEDINHIIKEKVLSSYIKYECFRNKL